MDSYEMLEPYEPDDWLLILLLLVFTMSDTNPEKIKMEELDDDKQESYSGNTEQTS